MNQSRNHILFAVGFAVACALGSGTATAADWEFVPRITLAETWTDNATLAGDGLEQSDWVTALVPGFKLSLDSVRARASLDYELQALWYAEESQYDDEYHNLDATGVFELVEDHFFLDAEGRYNQANIDPTGRLARSNIYQTGNRTDYAVYGLSPYWRSRFGSWAETELRYQYRGVEYTDTDDTQYNVQDSDTHAAYWTLGSSKDLRRFWWELQASYARTEFEFAQEYEYGRGALDLGVPVGVRTWLTLTGGVESDVAEDPSQGGFDSSFWYAGWRWQPTDLQELSARVGDRFYGTAYDFEWRRKGSRGDLSVTYKEEPTTANSAIFDGGIIDVGGTPRLDGSIYLHKRFEARASYKLTRTRVSLSAYADERDYDFLEAGGTGSPSDYYGARFNVDWDAGARTTVRLDTEYQVQDQARTTVVQSEFDRFFNTPGTTVVEESEGHVTRVSLGIDRRIRETLVLSGDVGYALRTSDSVADYSVTGASVSIRAEF